jgi:hypothetical protein
MTKVKSFSEKYQSAIHSFIASFIFFILVALSQLDPALLFTAKYWTINVVLSLIWGGIRAGVKTVSPLSK